MTDPDQQTDPTLDEDTLESEWTNLGDGDWIDEPCTGVYSD